MQRYGLGTDAVQKANPQLDPKTLIIRAGQAARRRPALAAVRLSPGQTTPTQLFSIRPHCNTPPPHRRRHLPALRW